MRNLLLFLAALLASAPALPGQNFDQKLSVPVTATVEAAPAGITLHWQRDPQATGYIIHRKNKAAATFFSQVANLPAGDSTWTDSGVVADKSYEYRIQENGTGGTGYINAGIALAPLHSRGRMILVVDSTLAPLLVPELDNLKYTLENDGWQVARIDVSRTAPVTVVKQRIVNAYQQDPTNTSTLFLFGHVPVPYSGEIAPDGHTNHWGAWPCDGFYADMDGAWTDAIVDTIAMGSDPRTHNVPGDGKFDQSTFPSKLELQVGRVDFYNLPAFPQTEVELMRRYLLKDKAWRFRQLTATTRGAIENNFPTYSEGFAQNGWKNFAPLVGADSVRYRDWDNLKNEDYLWAYGCGGGSYDGASGIMTTQQFATDTLKVVFTMTFGSYFGDWDSPNNLLRSAIASPGNILANAWAGRPNWQFHHLGLGETLGYAAFVTMNNTSTYIPGSSPNRIHIALMGDPTLRMTIVAPPTGNISVALYQSNIQFNFGDSPDPDIAGYFVYRRLSGDSLWTLLTPEPIPVSEYLDTCLTAGVEYDYLAKAVKLETTPSGTYWNLSVGARVNNLAAPFSPFVPEASFTSALVSGAPVAAFDAELNHVTTWEWDFGDGYTSTEEDPSHTFPSAGTFIVTLTALGSCGQLVTVSDTIELTSAAHELRDTDHWRVFPNPAREELWLENRAEVPQNAALRLFSPDGRLVFAASSGWLSPGASFRLPVQDLPGGVYSLEIQGESGVFVQKILLR